MPRSYAVAIPIVALMIACMPFMVPSGYDKQTPNEHMPYFDNSSDISKREHPSTFIAANSEEGVLDPVKVEHTGVAVESTQSSGRKDVDPLAESEAFLPSGAPGNQYSADCTGGYFLVGAGGSADFGSPAGTISLWLKWDITAPHGRFWGQGGDFETRWSSNALVLDWGSDWTLTGTKTNWETNHWYFIAITWDENTNFLGIYWGDEDIAPMADINTTSWAYSVIGLHLENDIMNSRAFTSQVDGHVDEFRYYTVRRSLEDIRGDYLLSLSGSESNLSHYYRFDNDLTDSAGNEYLVASGAYMFSRDVFRYPDSWRAEQIAVSVSELKMLYAHNGTFESGNPGTNEDWIGDGQYYADGWLAQRRWVDWHGRQRASYVEDDPSYVLVENEGYPNATGDGYWHYNGTEIFWYQIVDNSEQNEQFDFNMNYLYQSGPIGSNFEDIFEFRFEIRDGPTVLWNWSIDLVNITQRSIWYTVGPLPINIPGAPTSFEARIVLEVSTESNYVEIPYNDPDLDGDLTNGMIVSVYVDDVSLTGAQALTCESIDLKVRTPETGSITVFGTTSTGVALLNHTYWEDAAIRFTFLANSSVSIYYSAKVSKMTRLYNSSYTTNLVEQGVAYNADPARSVNLSLFTYMQSYPRANDLGFIAYHPTDWQNATVEDPFGSDITNSCIMHLDAVEIPTGIADSVGWWKIRLSGPNYARAISSQAQNVTTSLWEDRTVFQSRDRIRCNMTIGTSFETPSSVIDLEITWLSPSATIWSSEVISNGTGCILLSGDHTFGPYNSTPGIWLAEMVWTNGSEVAFGIALFEVYHRLNVFAYTPAINVQVNENFTATVGLYDQDTTEVILSGDATVVGNWSGTEVYFSPNLAKGWWEVDLNTSQTGIGYFVLIVNATMPFHSKTSCVISIRVLAPTVMTVIGDQYVEIGPGDSYEAKLRYMFYDGLGIDNASISVLSWSGPTGGLNHGSAKPVLGELGNYTMEFSANFGGTYRITIAATKEHHSIAAASFYLIVGPAPTTVTAYGISELYYEGRAYDFALFYNSTLENGVVGAELIASQPIRDFISYTESGGGWYNFTLTPTFGDWNATFWLSKAGYQEQRFTFTLKVAKTPLLLGSDYPLNQTYTKYEYEVFPIKLSLIDNNTGEIVKDATVEYFLLETNVDNPEIKEQGKFIEQLGVYSANITAPEEGLYLLRIVISKVHYEEKVEEIFLSSIIDVGAMSYRTLLVGFIGALVLLLIIAIVTLGRRFYVSRTVEKNIELLKLKGRLNDTKNLIALLVIHKDVGLPIYSRIIKGGFDESLISSFIAAISQFRSEFSMDEPLWTSIPLTELITVVQTELLICAIVTVETASARQKQQLESLGKEIGELYDHEDEQIKGLIHNSERTEDFFKILNPIFDYYFDGALMARYVGVKKGLPKNLTPISEALANLEIGYGATIGQIIEFLVTQGNSEFEVHKMIFEAVEGDFLIPAATEMPALIEIS